MAINYRTHFAHRIDLWDADGENVIEHLAGVEDPQVAMAAGVSATRTRRAFSFGGHGPMTRSEQGQS